VTASQDPRARASRPAVVGGDDAGFLDAPGVEAGVLFETIEGVMSGLPGGAVLTVYTDDPAVSATAAEWCADRDVELLTVISHEHGGTTLALRRRGGSTGPAAPTHDGLHTTEASGDPSLRPKT
jgi:TusA-related sulfurtransferase